VWAPAERIVSGIQRLTNQVNGVLFPLIVDSDTTQQQNRLQQILVQGTRFSLATVIPISAAVFVLADPLIRVWLRDKADEMAACIPVLQILTIAVVVRVGDATSTTLLKGTGKHKMLAWVNLGTGVVNVALSSLLIGPFGLIGVAYGTVIPITAAAALILFPAACRKVGLSTAHVAWHGIVPAVWPALPVAGLLWVLRSDAPPTLLMLILHSAVGALVYLVLFFGIAIGRRDRALYVQKARELIGRRSAAVGPKAPLPGAVLGGQ